MITNKPPRGRLVALAQDLPENELVGPENTNIFESLQGTNYGKRTKSLEKFIDHELEEI